MSRRSVCVVTGTRADYGALRPVMHAIRGQRGLNLQVAVTGMHLLKAFGMTARIVEQDCPGRTFRVRMQATLDSPAEQAEGLGRGITGMAQAFQSHGTEVVVVLGDRIEALAGALAGSLSGLAVVHIHGGELATGQQDDAIRHAISKIAHLHLVATTEAAARLTRMGEAKSRIHRVGAPALDTLYQMKVPPPAWIEDLLGMPAPDGFAIVAQHPVSPDANIEKRHMCQTLRAVADAGLPALVIWPNSDPGHSGILDAIASPPAGLAARVVRSLPHEDFLRALLAARLLVGNSSAGIIEAPAAGTPSVNIGPRQAGRLQDRTTTINCHHTRPAIAAAIQRALRIKGRLHPHRPTPYGDGGAARRIARAIATLRIDDRLLRKQNSY
jgi:GDP/UDP-N,N'-diacetylbacillosamine 2-epimerase (hydrolysing)